jgi:hypothetical protein
MFYCNTLISNWPVVELEPIIVDRSTGGVADNKVTSALPPILDKY